MEKKFFQKEFSERFTNMGESSKHIFGTQTSALKKAWTTKFTYFCRKNTSKTVFLSKSFSEKRKKNLEKQIEIFVFLEFLVLQPGESPMHHYTSMRVLGAIVMMYVSQNDGKSMKSTYVRVIPALKKI